MQVVVSSNRLSYEVGKQLGGGTFGRVHLARCLQDNMPVAIKFLRDPSNPQNVQRFQKEALELQRLNDVENVLSLLDCHFSLNQQFIVLEFCEWGTVQKLKDDGDMTYTNLHSVAIGAVKGLVAVHQRGGIHRDIKPANLLIGRNRQGLPVTKLSDFGLANLPDMVGANITRTLCGTPEYWAPELYKGKDCTAETDIFALGVTLIELLTGFREVNNLNLYQNIPKEFRDLLREMVSHDPRNRPTAENVLDRLNQIVNQPHFTANQVLGVTATALGIGGVLYLIGKLFDDDRAA